MRSPKDERVTGAKDGSFEAIAASLSGRALNFPRLNRSTLDGDSGDGVVFLLTFDCTRSRKGAHVSSFTPYIYDGNRGIVVEEAKIAASIRIQVFFWMNCPRAVRLLPSKLMFRK